MRQRLWIGRIGLVVASSALWLGAAELLVRRGVPAGGLTPFRNSSVAGLPHELAAGRTTTYKGVPVRINSQGFRGPELTDPPPGSERIVLVGDSVTFGNGCPEEGTLAPTLERALRERGRAAQVLNCGIPGFGAENVLTLTRARLVTLHPARLIYIFVANDVTPPQPAARIPDDAVIDPLAEFPLRSALLQWAGVRVRGMLRSFGASEGGYIGGVRDTFTSGGGDMVGRVLADLQSLCRREKIELLVACYPFMVRPSANPFRTIEEDCGRRCAGLGIEFEALVGAFDAEEDLTRYWVAPLASDAHPNAAANARVAAKLADRLAK